MPVTPTTVLVDLRKPSDTGTDVPAAGYLECVPSLRRHVDNYVVLPQAFNEQLVSGAATIYLAPTDGTVWYWKITERTNRGSRREVTVPVSGTPVQYADLPDILVVPVTEVTAATAAALTAEAATARAAEATLTTNVATNATAISTETTRATTAEGLKLAKASNLSDLASASTARTNLGLGTAATQASTAFDAAGVAAIAFAAEVTNRNSAISAAIDAVTTSDIIATSTAGALTIGKWTRVDATAGTKAMTLANAATARQVVVVEKSDSTANTVTISLGLRGSAGSLTLDSQFQTFVLVADDDLNWYVQSTHRTKTSFDALYASVASVTTNTTNIAANTTAIALKADKSANLTDLANAAIARENLALGDYTKLRPFYADLANRRNKRVDIACFGDSTFEGYGLTGWDYTLPAQLAATLRAQYGVTTGARGLVPIENDLTNQPFWPHVYTGGTITNVGYGVNMKQIGLFSTGQKFVHTVATPLTSFYIHYAIFSTGTFYYKIDGGSAVNVICNGTGTIVPTRLLVSSAVTSTIEVGWVSGSAYVDGIQENKNDETSGIQVHNLGYSGSSANSWVGQTSSRSWPVCAAVLQPSLMILQLGANDGRIAALNRTAAQFQADLTTLLGTLETLVSTTAPILVSMTYSVGDSLLREPWANYLTAAATVCAADTRAVLANHSARMYASNTTDTLSLYNAAAPPHAAAKGYALMAETLAASLAPR